MAQLAIERVQTAAWHLTEEVPLPAPVGALKSYHLGKRLDAGGANELYEALLPGMPRRVAIKFLRRARRVSPAAQQACRHDTVRVASCGHPHIASVVALGTSAEGVPFVVRELLEGESLQACLNRRVRMLPAAAVHVVRAIASGLTAAHDLGVIHGALRPAKVILQRAAGYPGGCVKLVDFGLWRLAGERRGPGALAELARYTPPELIVASTRPHLARIDARADQFALAAIAYRMIAGVDAFPGDDVAAVLRTLLEGAPAPLDRLVPCDAMLAAVIHRGLARDPADRFDSAMAFATAFAEAVEDGPEQVTQPIYPAQILGEAFAEAQARQEPLTVVDDDDDSVEAESRPGRARQRGPLLPLTLVLAALAAGLAWSNGWLPAAWQVPSSFWSILGGG
jgi:serine/threonine protein kinase